MWPAEGVDALAVPGVAGDAATTCPWVRKLPGTESQEADPRESYLGKGKDGNRVWRAGVEEMGRDLCQGGTLHSSPLPPFVLLVRQLRV